MKRIVNLVGARPQFIKAAMISRVLQSEYKAVAEEILIHSGQHYDYNLSGVFFDQMKISKPQVHLELEGGDSDARFAEIKKALKRELEHIKPDAIIVYGDTNTTRAGAEAAQYLNIPIAHVEAGLRSFNQDMPEENNRMVTDSLSTFLFTPNNDAIDNLEKESILTGDDLILGSKRVVENVGDVMLDSLRLFGSKARLSKAVESRLEKGKPMLLVTVHRNYNADDPQRLEMLLEALTLQTERYQVVFPVHPRTAKSLNTLDSIITFLPPLSYFDMMALEQRATMILTDSGGVQKEAYFFKKPLIILRHETEWTELLQNNVAVLCDVSPEVIAKAIANFENFEYPKLPDLYGDGYAAERICKTIISGLQ